jgi:hypothetical protein
MEMGPGVGLVVAAVLRMETLSATLPCLAASTEHDESAARFGLRQHARLAS